MTATHGLYEPKLPNLSPFPNATPEEVSLAKQYTRISSVAGEGAPEAHRAWLVIGHQRFALSGCYMTAEEASWLCWQLAKALGYLIESQRKST